LNKALLALEDGTVFEGCSFGARTETSGEVVFNTSITGYQEIFTDPSYAGQIVVLTAPQIGNYGSNQSDNEAARPFIEGLVVREFSPIASNWRSQQEADDFLAAANIPVGSNMDTRALVRHLRSRGVMRGVLSAVNLDPAALVEKARNVPSMSGLDLATRVSTREAYKWERTVEPVSPSEHIDSHVESGAPLYHVVAYDFGIKHNILRKLVQSGTRVTVVPALTSAEDVLALKPDGVFLSNGPGDPEPLEFQTQQVRNLVGKTPIFGICLGHQILGRALGAKTYKLKFGHRGVNQPVLDKLTGKIEITTQNHGFAVDMASLEGRAATTHVHLNDQTSEGLAVPEMNAFSVQYHPEAAAGPHDALYLFERFTKMIDRARA
jgi:carbamoyl-phosphate synthase small subunit